MPITPTNQSKNTITPVGQAKSFLAQAVYGIGAYGIAAYGVGTAMVGMFINQSKSALSTILELQDGTNFLLQDGSNLQMQGGSGALVYTNQSKN